MSDTSTSIYVHCVFSTKNRVPLIGAEWRPHLWAYLGGIARANSFKAIAVGGTGDHVHVLLSLPATIAVAKAVQLVKGGSSKWARERQAKKFSWQAGYGAFSVGIAQIKSTIRYIKQQEVHHARRDYTAEYALFLRRHGIELADFSRPSGT